MMIKNEYKHSEITAKIIGCAMKVHQRCLCIEFDREGIKYQQEMEMPIFYDGIHVGKRRADFLIEEKVVLEIKAVSELTDTYLAQALNYLEALNLETGLLLNFGAKSLEIKRIVNGKKKESS